METFPGTSYTRAQLRVCPVFADLRDEDLDWLLANGERVTARKDEVIAREGDPINHLYVMTEGALQWQFNVAGGTTVLTEERVGFAAGALPYSRAKTQGGNARALRDVSAYRLHKDKFPEMLRRIPELGARLVQTMTDRVRNSTRLIDQREKIAALGKMAAGLAHELNNPAAALKRSAAELSDRFTKLASLGPQLMKLEVKPDDIDCTVEFRNKLWQRTPPEFTAVQRAEREDELSDWLEDHGVPEPWVVAENLAEVGATLADLEDYASRVSPTAMAFGLRWIDGVSVSARMIREILSAADRISQLVGAIKVHAHLDSNPDKQPTDLHAGIESTLTILGHKLKKKRIVVRKEFTADMPHPPAHPGELNQVWTNLIDNAIDAMDDGGVLTIKTGTEASCACVRVCDTGHGIPEDVKARIFDPFFTTKPMGEGTGLGLDIVHRIITQQHNGDIEVDSKPGSTCFTVWLPLNPLEK
ncbi:MAG: cyclic nucleotide-binding domain-containing protein [Planctomycetes bacterium]|nr:cyclic nucleotide-binding domain-containing protein [Planctomycetota bacterium]MCW8135035.1 cyclic nucleotide-binding domain-containing protein [Planctomycetota bacterium]